MAEIKVKEKRVLILTQDEAYVLKRLPVHAELRVIGYYFDCRTDEWLGVYDNDDIELGAIKKTDIIPNVELTIN